MQATFELAQSSGWIWAGHSFVSFDLQAATGAKRSRSSFCTFQHSVAHDRRSKADSPWISFRSDLSLCAARRDMTALAGQRCQLQCMEQASSARSPVQALPALQNTRMGGRCIHSQSSALSSLKLLSARGQHHRLQTRSVLLQLVVASSACAQLILQSTFQVA